MRNKLEVFFAILMGALIDFAVLAHAAHDLWAATLVHIIVVCFFVVVLWVYSSSGESSGLSLPLLGPAFLILFFFFLSFRQAATPSESQMYLMDWLSGLLLFFISIHIFRSTRIFSIFLICLIPAIFIECALHIRQNIEFLQNVGLTDPRGTLINANISAAFHLIWFPLFLSRALKERSDRDFTFYLSWVVIPLLISIVVLTHSIWAFVCLFVGLPFLFSGEKLFKFKKAYPRIFHLAAILIMCAVVGCIGYKIRQVFFVGHDYFNRPSTNRFLWWKSSWNMFKDHPYFGIGIGNYPSAYQAYKVGPSLNTRYPHSFFAGLFGEAGIFGFLSVIFFFALWVREALKYRSDRPRWAAAIGVFMFLLFVSISIGMEYLVNLLSCFLLMGYTLAGVSSTLWKPRKSVLIVLTAGAVTLLPFIISPLMASQEEVYGWECLNKKADFDEAIKSFSLAEKLDPHSFQAPSGLAASYWQRFVLNKNASDLEKAIKNQEKAIARNKLSSAMWFDRGRYYQAAGNTKEAEESYSRALQLDKRTGLTGLKDK